MKTGSEFFEALLGLQTVCRHPAPPPTKHSLCNYMPSARRFMKLHIRGLR